MVESKYKVGDVVDVNYEGTEYTSEIKYVRFINDYFYYTLEKVNDLHYHAMYTNINESRIIGLHKESKAEEETMLDMYPSGTYVVYEDSMGDLGVAKVVGYKENLYSKTLYNLEMKGGHLSYMHPDLILCSIDEARIVGNVGKEYKVVSSSMSIPKFKNGEFVYVYTHDNYFTRFKIDGIFVNGDGYVSYYDEDGNDWPETAVFVTKDECLEYIKSLVTFED